MECVVPDFNESGRFHVNPFKWHRGQPDNCTYADATMRLAEAQAKHEQARL